jgi:hypothetical protein
LVKWLRFIYLYNREAEFHERDYPQVRILILVAVRTFFETLNTMGHKYMIVLS